MIGERRPPVSRTRVSRGLVVAACLGGYGAVFIPAWAVLGDNVAPLAIVPVIAAGWFFGSTAGVVIALVTVAMTWALVFRVSPEPNAVMLRNVLTITAGVVIGGATGWLRQLLAATRRQARRLEQRHARAMLEAGLRKAAEEELRRVNTTLERACDEAVRASDEKSRFLARASHELRTPLAAIQGYAELLLEEGHATGEPPATLQRDLGRIVEASRHLTALVDELLDVSKIETGRLEVHLAPTNLKALVEDVTALMQPAAAAAGTRLRVACEADLPDVRTDPRRARQVLLNLLSNAIKFTGEGNVEVVAARARVDPSDWAEVEVRDTGPGMSAEDQEFAFEEFWRGRTDKPGVGLGLAIARRLCRELGGSIDVSAAPGAGTAFVVRLPLAASTVEAASAEVREP